MVVAGSVHEAIDFIESGVFRFGAVVTDYNLGDGWGRDIIKAIRSKGLGFLMIVMSGSLRIDRE